jgi:hypothetical protein
MSSVHGYRQDFPFSQVVEWIKINPNRCKQLAPIEVSYVQSMDNIDEQDNYLTLESIGLPTFQCVSLKVGGPLAAIGWIKDQIYRNEQRPERLRELATEWQKATDNLSDSLVRRRKKIHDGIGSLINSTECKDWLEVFGGLALMNNVQLVFVRQNSEGEESESEKKILFSSDPSLWSAENSTWIVDYNARWIGVPVNENGQSGLAPIINWLEDAESHGWIVEWGVVKGATKAELLEVFSTMPSWRPEMKKLLKDDLAYRLGRARAIQAIGVIARYTGSA